MVCSIFRNSLSRSRSFKISLFPDSYKKICFLSSTPNKFHDHEISNSQCWKCGKRQNCCHLFCSECGKIQPVGTSCCNYFKLLDMPVSFKVDERSLEQNYKKIQKVTHPDKFSMASEMERNASTISATTINQAYQALRCPVDRAKYLLSLQGINALNEDSNFEDPELMMEIFELRETIDELRTSKNYEGARKLLLQLKDTANSLCDTIEKTFQSNQLKETTRASVNLKYISKAIDEVMAIIPSS